MTMTRDDIQFLLSAAADRCTDDIPATDRQISYLATLITKRGQTHMREMAAMFEADETLTSYEASELIHGYT